MKILLTSAKKNAASFIFYSKSLSKIDGLVISNNPKEVDYSKFDVALFMGYDEHSELAKRQNKDIYTGVLDPRPNKKISKEVDFIAANDIESKDFFSKIAPTIIYHTFPIVPEKAECPIKKDRLVIGYHGNKVHLEAMVPRISDALEKLNSNTPIELWAMYNVEKLGKWNQKFSFPVKHIQYKEENYARYIAHVDIGIVPQLIPTLQGGFIKKLISPFGGKFNEEKEDYLLRFKTTTNRGRHLVFAQYGIPVVSDMTPSALGLVANSTSGWYESLKELADNKELRRQLGDKLRNEYQETATPEIQNARLLKFLKENV